MYTALGRRAVAHCTALGKVLLAHRPWMEVRQTIERFGWRPYTPSSIGSYERLQGELNKIRKQGYAVDREERRLGVICMAAPIRERAGKVVAALSATGTLDRMTDEFCKQILPRVLEAANRISFRLGYHGSSAYL